MWIRLDWNWVPAAGLSRRLQVRDFTADDGAHPRSVLALTCFARLHTPALLAMSRIPLLLMDIGFIGVTHANYCGVFRIYFLGYHAYAPLMVSRAC